MFIEEEENDGGVNERKKRRKVYIKYNGQKKSLYEWSKETGIRRRILYSRLQSGWSPKDILTRPLERRGRKLTKNELKYHEVYLYILRYKLLHDGNSPSMRQAGRDLDMPLNKINYWISRLSEAGLLFFDEHQNIITYGGEWSPPKESDIDELLETR